MNTKSPGACPVRKDTPRMNPTDLRRAAALIRKLPVDHRDQLGKRLKREAIGELLRLAERRTTRRPS